MNEEEENTKQVKISEVVVESVGQQDLSNYQLVRDRGNRQVKQPLKLRDYQIYEGEEVIAGFAYLITENAGRPEPRNHKEEL